jgi:hypothetical protein
MYFYYLAALARLSPVLERAGALLQTRSEGRKAALALPSCLRLPPSCVVVVGRAGRPGGLC